MSLHRFLLNVTDKNQFVDHINHDTLDNRKSNLRICSLQENSRNRKKAKTNKSGYKGVVLYKQSGKWKAYTKVNMKSKHLGYYDTKEEAALAYNDFAKKTFGEFCYLNDISEDYRSIKK